MGPRLRTDLNATGVELLLTDLDAALTFLDVAEVTGIEETARRNHHNARRAYDTVLHLLQNLRPTAEQQQLIDQKLAVLRARLEAVGQTF